MRNNKILKKHWSWLILAMVAIVFFLFFKFDLPASPVGGPALPSKQSSLVLDFGDSTSRKFQGPVAPDMTILEALYSASVNGHFEFRYSIDKNGVLYIAKIGDVINSSGKPSWHFYLNGKLAETSKLNITKIKTGDLIEAKYE